MKDIDPIEKARIEKMTKHLQEQSKIPREERLRQVFGATPLAEIPPEMLESLSRHLDEQDKAAFATENEEFVIGKDVREFVITPEMWNEAITYYHAHRDKLIQEAITQIPKAISHRTPPFQVGCVVIGIAPSPDEEGKAVYKTWKGYNLKARPGTVKGVEKRCAERTALEEAEFYSTAVPAIVIVSKELSTGDETKAHTALHPCLDCRMMFRELIADGFLKPDTIICSVNNSKPELAIDERKLKDLLSFYDEDPHL